MGGIYVVGRWYDSAFEVEYVGYVGLISINKTS